MIRKASIITIAVALIPTFAFAQGAQFTVSVQSAAVRKAPSTGSPVVGQAARGAVLEVTRDIGSWVKVAWPDAPDGVGYVHVSMGTIAQRASREERLATAFASLPPPETAAPESAALQASPQPVAGQLTGAVYVPPPTHMVGFGGQMSGATPAFGFTSRVWSRSRIGLQLDLSQSTLKSSSTAERVRSTAFVPSVVYSLPDYVGSSLWLRPYVGSGVAMMRSKLTSGTPEVSAAISKSGVAVRAFGGAEATIPNMPRFAISADAGYEWADEPFAGFDLGGPIFTISGHWYLK